MSKAFRNTPPRPTDPPRDMFTVVPSDVQEYPDIIRQIVIDTGGNLAVTTLAGVDRIVPVKAGQTVTCMVTRILATGTTATIQFVLT